MADGLVVASGRSHRHVGAMADHLLRTLKDEGYGKARVGHPLRPGADRRRRRHRAPGPLEVRAFYNIEKIWAVDAPHRTPAAL